MSGLSQGLIDKLRLVLTIYIALFIYSSSYERKGKSRKWRIPVFCLCVACIVGVCFLAEFFKITGGNTFLIAVYKNGIDILLIVACIASMCIIKTLGVKSILFIGCASLATSNCAYNLYSVVVTLFSGPELSPLSDLGESILRWILYIGFYVCIYTLCWYFLVRKYKSNGKEYAINNIGYPLFIACFIVNLFIGGMEPDTVSLRFQLIGKILTNLLILFFLFYQSRYLNLREENIRLQYLMEQQKQQFMITKESFEQVNIKAHDLKHVINIIKGGSEASDELVSSLTDIYNNYESIYKTGNSALDITLDDKCRNFVKNGVQSSIIADGALLSFMSDVDVYILFGNLIDNALEAMLQIEDANRRIFGVYLKKIDKIISLHSENTFEKAPVFSEGMPQTGKSDKNNHGYGIKSMKMITEKYGGIFKLSCDDKFFKVDIAFFIN